VELEEVELDELDEDDEVELEEVELEELDDEVELDEVDEELELGEVDEVELELELVDEEVETGAPEAVVLRVVDDPDVVGDDVDWIAALCVDEFAFAELVDEFNFGAAVVEDGAVTDVPRTVAVVDRVVVFGWPEPQAAPSPATATTMAAETLRFMPRLRCHDRQSTSRLPTRCR
jgi:hypothetical protein